MSAILLRKMLSSVDSHTPGRITPSAALTTALVLVLMLAFFVPIVAIATRLPLLLLVFLAGLLFLVYLFVTDQLLVGTGTAFFVLLTFYADVPLTDVPGTERASIYLFDPLLLLVSGLVLYWHRESTRRIPRSGRVAIVLLALFAGWSAISALVGNGPSQAAAFVFAVDQLRFSLVLLAATLYVLHTDPRCAVYPLLVAISSHGLVALVQAVNGTSFGLSYLGEGSLDPMGQTTIGPFVYQASQHTGGFTGNARILVGLLLLLTPVLVVQLLGSRRKATIGILWATVSGILILIGNTDSGLAAFVLVMVSLLGGILLLYRRNLDVPPVRASVLTISVVGGTIVLRAWDRITRHFADTAPPPGGSSSTEGTSKSTTGDGESAANGSGPSGDGAETVVNKSGSPGDGAETVVNGSDPTMFGGLISTDTLGIRLHQYAAALDLTGRYPLFGVGGSNFNILAQTYGLPAEMAIHNIFLSYLAATGVPGALLFLGSLTAVVAVSLRGILVATGARQALLLGLLAGIIGYLAFAFWTTVGEITVAMATFWSICGIAIGASTTDEW